METKVPLLQRSVIEDAERWNALLAQLPNAHVLQSWQWGQVKQRVGWKMIPVAWRDDSGKIRAAALLLKRPLRAGGLGSRLSVLYCPRGPILDWADAGLREALLNDLQNLAKEMGSIFLKMDPDVPMGMGVPGTPEAVDDPAGLDLVESLKARGWRFSEEQIQFRNTVLIDLRLSEEALLGKMKQKTRYNIRLAEKKGVHIRLGTQADLPMLYKMYAETSIRDGFVIRDQAYYEFAWGHLLEQGLAEILIAEAEGESMAAVIIYRFADHAWYLNGMSRNLYRERMPNYLLQWEAMRTLKSQGCTLYDLWGAPDHFDETDSMWGVFRFKEGLGGYVLRTPGAWDFPVRRLTYRLYTQVLPRIMDLMRRRGKAQTREAVLS